MVIHNRASNFVNGVKAVITFFTVIPIGGSHDVVKAFEYVWLATLIIPPITGLVPGLVGYYIWITTHNGLFSASIAYTSLLLLTGLNHIDGFSDVIDALMVRGSVEDRIKVLKDPHRGSAAIAMVTLSIILAISALLGLTNRMWQSLFVAEVISKSSCCLSALIGREPPYRGLGWQLTVIARRRITPIITSSLLGLAITYVMLGIIGAVSFTATILISILIFMHLQGKFSGAVGDLYGFILEVSRVLSLMIMLVLFNI